MCVIVIEGWLDNDAIRLSVDFFFFFKQKTAYEIYQCDWSSDVCSSDLEAISAGMVYAGKLSRRMGMLKREDFHKMVDLFKADRKSVV